MQKITKEDLLNSGAHFGHVSSKTDPNFKDFVVSQNKENYPFFMEGIGFKKGSDILTESTRLYLLEDLLSCSKKVYVESIFESNFEILNKLSKDNENLEIVDSKDDIKEEVYEIIY